VSEAAPGHADERFLVCTPTGRDGALTCSLLHKAGLTCVSVPHIPALLARVEEGAAALLLAEEVLSPASLQQLAGLLMRQPPWSDLPLILFTGAAASVDHRPNIGSLLGLLGNVTLLDRPVRPLTMVSAARSALRARRRQYAAREELVRQDRAVRARDQFLAMLGHELRNPLGAILMAIELMERRPNDAPAQRAIVRRQSQHLARLVDDLLDVSRVTSGKIILQRTPVDLEQLIERCLEAVDAAVKAHRLSVTVKGPDRRVSVDGDSVRLEQVVTNLLTNAIKYTPSGGQIAISIDREDARAVLRVRDNGVGIAPDMLPRIFDLFAQAEGTLDRARGGMGIGLTLVRSLIALHGGTVEAESAGIGQGSVFTVRLPALPERDRTYIPPLQATHPAGNGVHHHILIVEDNADMREILKQLLEDLGHRVSAVENGALGVEHAIAHHPEVLLVDIGLPGLDGYGVARRLREELGQRVFLVALTGYGQPEDRRLALEAGFDVHMTKPVDLEAMEKLLGQRDLRASQVRPARRGE
jgi:signal transduction histidine kinase/ActR/RegA family two-component response regulator